MYLTYFAYLAFFIFGVAMIYRAVRIAATPVHLRWELYPVPHEAGGKAKYGGSYLEELNWWQNKTSGSKIGELTVMIPEIVFLKGVWESNRGLWFWSWGFHMGLYLGIVAFVAVIFGLIVGVESSLGQIVGTLTSFAVIIGYILGALGTLGMLIKRFTDNKLKPFTSIGAIFNLLFILAIFVTGLGAVYLFGGDGYVGQLQGFCTTLIGSTAAMLPTGIMVWHLAVVLLFLLYMPFTHMAHMVLKYFTYHDIRWNDKPNLRGSKMEKKIGEVLQYKPTWAAKHINADGKKNWVDIATEEIDKKDEKA